MVTVALVSSKSANGFSLAEITASAIQKITINHTGKIRVWHMMIFSEKELNSIQKKK